LQSLKLLLQTSFLTLRRQDNIVMWNLRRLPGVLEESQRLASLENVCCGGLKFDIESTPEIVVWKIFADAGNEALLKKFEDLPNALLKQN